MSCIKSKICSCSYCRRKNKTNNNSDDQITFTKIIKQYKCGICDKKIKDYCKCINSHHGSNIITIMSNPNSDLDDKKIIKGEKGDKGLTGSMGLPGNSFIIFMANDILSGDYIGINYSDKDFIKTSIMIPYDFIIKQIGFTIKNKLAINCTITAILYINNKETDYKICICNGEIYATKIYTTFIQIKPSDLFCFKINYNSDILINRICINMVIN